LAIPPEMIQSEMFGVKVIRRREDEEEIYGSVNNQ